MKPCYNPVYICCDAPIYPLIFIKGFPSYFFTRGNQRETLLRCPDDSPQRAIRTVSTALRRGREGGGGVGGAGPAHGATRVPVFCCAQRERERERRGLLLLVTENGSEHIQSGEQLMRQGRREKKSHTFASLLFSADRQLSTADGMCALSWLCFRRDCGVLQH